MTIHLMKPVTTEDLRTEQEDNLMADLYWSDQILQYTAPNGTKTRYRYLLVVRSNDSSFVAWVANSDGTSERTMPVAVVNSTMPVTDIHGLLDQTVAQFIVPEGEL